jgi:hypothetical protein
MKKNDLVVFRMYKMQLPKYAEIIKCGNAIGPVAMKSKVTVLSRRILEVSPDNKNILINLNGKKNWVVFDPNIHKIMSA